MAVLDQELSVIAVKMSAVRKLSYYFTSTVPEEGLHIIVEAPRAPSSVPMIINTTPRKNDEIEELTKSFVPPLKERINAYLKNHTQLPPWKPQQHQGSDEMQRQIESLKLPARTLSSPFPSLLLHNLGQPSHDPLLAGRIARLFALTSDIKYSFSTLKLRNTLPIIFISRFLCNTSGSGKTRLLLEGFWRNWGFYFTARSKPENIGSGDVASVLSEMRPRIKRLAKGGSATENHALAGRRFLSILYVRIFFFRVYLDCASAVPGGITEEHKGRWLLLQVAPDSLDSESDNFVKHIDNFVRHVNKLKGISDDFLEKLTDDELDLVGKHIKGQELFCVLDEAQIPTKCLRAVSYLTQGRKSDLSFAQSFISGKRQYLISSSRVRECPCEKWRPSSLLYLEKSQNR